MTTPVSVPIIPPLENGDRLTQAEFERRYSAMSHLKKAELIEGIRLLAEVREQGMGNREQCKSLR